MLKKHKFNIGDIVTFKDEFSYNPANKATAIGKVEIIYILSGKEIFIRTGKGETQAASLKGKVSYGVSGNALIRNEEELELYHHNKEKV